MVTCFFSVSWAASPKNPALFNERLIPVVVPLSLCSNIALACCDELQQFHVPLVSLLWFLLRFVSFYCLLLFIAVLFGCIPWLMFQNFFHSLVASYFCYTPFSVILSVLHTPFGLWWETHICCCMVVKFLFFYSLWLLKRWVWNQIVTEYIMFGVTWF